MKKFDYQQKISMMRILLDIINADGRIDIREKALFDHLKTEFELDDYASHAVRDKISILALIDISHFNQEQKAYFADLMRKMIVVDDDVNVNEVAVYEVVKDYCKIPD